MAYNPVERAPACVLHAIEWITCKCLSMYAWLYCLYMLHGIIAQLLILKY